MSSRSSARFLRPLDRAIRRGLAAAIGALLAGCTAEPEHPALKEAQLPPLIQAHRFAYRGAAEAGYQLSPDGSKLLWFGPRFGRSALHVRDNATGAVRTFRVAGGVQWTPDGRRLLYLSSDTSGAENSHVYVIDVDDQDAKPVDLTPWDGVKAGIHQILSGEPSRVLIYHNRRDRRFFDLYRIDLTTRKATLVSQNPGDGTTPITAPDGTFKGWTTSRALKRRAAGELRPLAERKTDLLKAPDETFQSLGLSADRSVLWALSNRGRDRVALVAAEPRLGWERVVFEDPDVDVTSVVMSRVKHAPLLVQAMPGYPRVAILDEQLRGDLGPLLNTQEGPYGLDIVSKDDHESHLVVSISSDKQRNTYLVDRQARTHVLLANSVDSDLAPALTSMKPVTLKSRDGMTLHGYLTLPRGTAGKGLPLVMSVHGGPWMRTGWGDPFSSEDAAYAQFFANRGYAVLQIDFRGSHGYGRSFKQAGMGEFAGRMQDDVLDAVRWAVDSGIADPTRVAIVGWSYGGYAALTALAFTPDVFACGVSMAGPTELASLIESFPPYWKLDLSLWHDFVGDPEIVEDREQMKKRSPLYRAGEIKQPVLIVHGERDVRVRVDQSDRMVAALRNAGKSVEYLRIPDMGHDLGWWPHRLAAFRKMETFLNRCLGGRASRFDWFDAVAWAWVRWSRFRESGGAPPAAPVADKQTAPQEQKRNVTADERK